MIKFNKFVNVVVGAVLFAFSLVVISLCIFVITLIASMAIETTIHIIDMF